MQSGVVEPAEIFDDRELELGAGAPDAVGAQLGLEAVEERLGQGVVVGVVDRSDGREQAVIIEGLAVVDAGVLRAGVGVVARRSSKFSLRKRRISSRSCVVKRSVRLPLSASARRTRLRNVSEWMPRSRATCAIGLPLSSASRTPRSNSSSGCFLGLDMTAEDLLSQDSILVPRSPSKPVRLTMRPWAPRKASRVAAFRTAVRPWFDQDRPARMVAERARRSAGEDLVSIGLDRLRGGIAASEREDERGLAAADDLEDEDDIRANVGFGDLADDT